MIKAELVMGFHGSYWNEKVDQWPIEREDDFVENSVVNNTHFKGVVWLLLSKFDWNLFFSQWCGSTFSFPWPTLNKIMLKDISVNFSNSGFEKRCLSYHYLVCDWSIKNFHWSFWLIEWLDWWLMLTTETTLYQ